MLPLLESRVRRVLRGLAAEFAYLALVNTSILPPHSLLRRRLIRVIQPEMLSFLAAKIGSDAPDVLVNSTIGMRLGGAPKCELLLDLMPELYQLCVALRTQGGEPLYKAMGEVVVPLAVASIAAGYDEGNILLASFRAAASRGDRDLETVMRYFRRWTVASFK
ncbi:hypothetical protein [Pyrobaculum neutrophilum]|uniref:Uncharacterized protein n=1 Tax=Pyrobaculum neutrophilum (strain DSM 2338 / JCM 9278 / NBRC 100436 / V24Sta) TaxID=444157 RepID=B1Y965_PYRNV|nr:hypothetical protein [Pyrobaculum neutrophilum]ACB40294.1 conserved hypothetical protein [Pyrobaculum neutrophilum V24Sta]